MSLKARKVAQYRLTGPTEGLRRLMHVEGPQRWRLVIRLQLADGGEDERVIQVDAPCHMSHLTHIYDREISEMCAGTPTVRGGGWDAYLLPKQARPQPQRRRLAA